MKYILYKTTCLINNKTYIGIHQTNNLDDGYLGSGLAFLRALKKYGKENFKREILVFCETYAELLEKEKEYVNEIWVKDKTNYNLKTGGQSSGVLSNESKKQISETLKLKYLKGEIVQSNLPRYIPNENQKKQISQSLKERYKINEHHSKNSIPWNKGKKGVQKAWNKGMKLGEMSDEQKKQISETLKQKYSNGEIKTKKGVEPWNKGKKGVQVSWNKGLKQQQTECPHCKKMVDAGNGKRWHFENCKLK